MGGGGGYVHVYKNEQGVLSGGFCPTLRNSGLHRMSALWSYGMVCAGVSGPKHYATIRHFQHETPDSPTPHLCIYISALFSSSPGKMILSNEGSSVRSQK